jgi:hypothetical protein
LPRLRSRVRASSSARRWSKPPRWSGREARQRTANPSTRVQIPSPPRLLGVPLRGPGPSRAIGAVVARFLDTEEVTGSNPVSPTSSIGPLTCGNAGSGAFVILSRVGYGWDGPATGGDAHDHRNHHSTAGARPLIDDFRLKRGARTVVQCTSPPTTTTCSARRRTGWPARSWCTLEWIRA